MATPPPLPPDAVPARRLDTRIRRMDGQLILAFGETALALSESGALLYEHMDGRRTVGMLAAMLAKTYGLAEQDALADTGEFVDSLVENSLAEVRDSPT